MRSLKMEYGLRFCRVVRKEEIFGSLLFCLFVYWLVLAVAR